MKLTVLADNNTFIDMYYLGEPAVSYYLEDGPAKVLFDAAYSKAFMSNAEKLGIDLNEVDRIVLSHGHNDHSGGLRYLLENRKRYKLIAHPAAFDYKQDDDGVYIGSTLGKEEIEKRCLTFFSREPYRVSEHLLFLGEIATVLDFEKRYPIGKTYDGSKKVPDLLYDDSALVYESPKGLFIITGCSHSGICNIIEQAIRVCKNDRIYGVIGGFHLFRNDERLQKTIAYLKKKQIELLYPCHCVSLEAKIEMGRQLPIREVGVGLELDI